MLSAVFAFVHGPALSRFAAEFLGFAAMAAVLVYLWFIARVGLDISGRVAVAIVGLDLGVSIVVNGSTMAMLR